MFGLDLLTKLIAGQPPAVESGRCLRRYRRASCQDCVEKCPAGLLRMDRLGPRIVGDCRGCGVCVGACPTGVFSLDSTSHNGLISAMQSAGDLDLTCATGQATDGGVKVPCLGYLSPGLLLALGAGHREVRLQAGSCGDCSLKSASSLIQETVSRTNAIVEAFSLPATVRVVVKAAHVATPSDRNAYSRRELFARLGGRGAQVGGSALNVWKQQLSFVGEAEDHLLDQPARLLRIQLKRLASSAADNDRRLLPLRRPMVKGGCDLCGLCAATCPSGALSKVDSDSTSQLRWYAGRCWSCRLCKDVCPFSVLDHEDGVPAAALLDEAGVVLASVPTETCSCGRRFVCRHGEKRCPHCHEEKRNDGWGSNLFNLGRPKACSVSELVIKGEYKR